MTNLQAFSQARLGIFIHMGLYSLLGRGEWVLNKEQIPIEQYRQLAHGYDPAAFDAEQVVQLAKQAGAKYLCFTTMHQDGFAMYDSDINPFNSMKLGPKRDFVSEIVQACRKHGLRIHLYHSLNHWTTQPDGVKALEDSDARKQFVDFAHQRVCELVTKFNPIDCLWYDGWWPFDAQGWRAEEMNQKVRAIQPHILFNGRNGLPGDFSTPEGHLATPKPYRPWEACITHNRNWGYHAGDTHFKSAADVIDMLTQVATGAGNLLINIGPDGRGNIPQPSVQMLQQMGQWLQIHGQAIYASEPFNFDLQTRDEQRGDFMHHGRYTAHANTLYIHLSSWPGEQFAIGGVQCQAKSCHLLACDVPVSMQQDGQRIQFAGLPHKPPHALGSVLAVEFDQPPVLYQTAGMRIPNKTNHPRYDPCPSDILA